MEEVEENEEDEEQEKEVVILQITFYLSDFTIVQTEFDEFRGCLTQINEYHLINQNYQINRNQFILNEYYNNYFFVINNILFTTQVDSQNNNLNEIQHFRIRQNKLLQVENIDEEIDQQINYNIWESSDRKYIIVNKFVDNFEEILIINGKNMKVLKYLSYETQQPIKQIMLQQNKITLFFDDQYVQIDLKSVTVISNYNYKKDFVQAFPLDYSGLQYLIIRQQEILIVDKHKLITRRQTPENIVKIQFQQDMVQMSETIKNEIVALTDKEIQLIDLRNSEILRSCEVKEMISKKEFLTAQDYVFVMCQANNKEQYIQMVDILYNKKTQIQYHACDSYYEYEKLKQWLRKRYDFNDFEKEMIKNNKYQTYFKQGPQISQILNYQLNPQQSRLYLLTNTSLTIFSIQDGIQLYGNLVENLNNIFFPYRSFYNLVKNTSEKSQLFEISDQQTYAQCIDKYLNTQLFTENKEVQTLKMNQHYDFIIAKQNILICFKQFNVDFYQIQYNEKQLLFQHISNVENVTFKNYEVFINQQNAIFYWDNNVLGLNMITKQLYLIEQLKQNIKNMTLQNQDLAILTDDGYIRTYKLLDSTFWRKIDSMYNIQIKQEEIQVEDGESQQYKQTCQLLEQIQNAIINPIKYRQNKKQMKKYNDNFQGFTFGNNQSQKQQIYIDKDLVFMQIEDIQQILNNLKSYTDINKVIQLWWIISYANYDIIYRNADILKQIKDIISDINLNLFNVLYKKQLEAEDIISNIQ